MDGHITLPALAVVIGCSAAVTVRVALAEPPAPARAATEAERRALAEAIAREEPAWRAQTAQHFPRDHWSQRDDFHGHELGKARELAKQRGVRVEDVLRAVDEDLHQRPASSSDAPDHRSARAIPCKPRPFYD